MKIEPRFLERIFAILILSSLILPGRSLAQSTYPQPVGTIGPRVTYTFGEGGGWNFGAEFTYFPRNAFTRSLPYAFTFDVLIQPGSSLTLHTGVENLSLIGVDLGPSITFANSKVYPAFTAIAYLGGELFFALEYTVYASPNIPNYLSCGGYLKLPVGGGGMRFYLPEGSAF